MNGLHVDPAQMEANGKETINQASALDEQIKSLTSNKESLLSIWKGQAAEAFNESVESQITNLNSFKALIEELGNRITTGASTFNTNEEENTALAKELLSDND